MEVIVITRSDEENGYGSSKIIGVRETEQEANALIEKDRKSNDHPLMSTSEWFSNKRKFRELQSKLLNDEHYSPKKGGWVKKFDVNQMSKKQREVYEKLCEVSGDIDYGQFYSTFLSGNEKYREYQWMLNAFLVPEFNIPFNDFEELRLHYMIVPNPEKVVYTKTKFDTKYDE